MGYALKLLEREREIIRAVELQAAIPITRLRTTLGYRDHTIRRALSNLQNNEVLGSVKPFTNFYKLGFIEFAIYLSLAVREQASREQILKYLESQSNVAYVAEIGGEYQYVVAMYGTHAREVATLLQELSDRFPNVLVHKTVNMRNAVSIFGRKYLSQKDYGINPLEVRSSNETVTLDDLDKKILWLLSYAKYNSISELAEKNDIPVTTFKRRKTTLEQLGIISGYFLKVDISKFDMRQYRLLIRAKGKSTEFHRKIYSFARVERNVTFFIDCIGSWDYELGVETSNPDQLLEVTSKLYGSFSDQILNIDLIPQFRFRKYCVYPFAQGEALPAIKVANM